MLVFFEAPDAQSVECQCLSLTVETPGSSPARATPGGGIGSALASLSPVTVGCSYIAPSTGWR